MEEVKYSTILDVSTDHELNEMISITEICRLCANQNDKLIGIFSEDGINNELANKMNLYLPIKVCETDDLPLQCCWQCASTVLAWHELVVTSVEADRRLRSYQFVTNKQLENVTENIKNELPKSTMEEHSRLNSFCQTDPIVEELSVEKSSMPSTFIVTSSNLTDFVTLPTQYITFGNNGIYSIKSEEKPPEQPSFEKQDPIESNTKGEQTDGFESENVSNEDDVFEDKYENEQPKIIGKDIVVNCFNCQICKMVFVNEKDLEVHLMDKHSEENFELLELNSESPKKEKRKNNRIDQELVNSAKVIVDGKVYYYCKECGRSLHSPYTYIWHMRIHTGERPHSCNICGRQFRVSQGLIRHIKETHEGIKNFPCDLCGRMFATKRNVEEHRRIHTNERPYVCDLCGKSFKQKASLFVHNRSHNDYFPFKCQYCDQEFRTRPPLLLHITKHTGEKPYPCEICGRKFRIKYELKRHRLIHSDEKPFSCNICGLSFKQKRYLRNHNKLNHMVSS